MIMTRVRFLGLVLLTSLMLRAPSASAAPKLLPITQKGRAALVSLVNRLFDPASHAKIARQFRDEILSQHTPESSAQLKAQMLKQANHWSPKNPRWEWANGQTKVSTGGLADFYTELRFGKRTSTYLEID
jgi:hypothetical protein